MNPRIRPWTTEEDLTAVAMRRDGSTLTAIADVVRRTHGGVSKRLGYLALSAEERLEKRREKRLGEPKRARAVVRERVPPPNTRVIPPAVLEERERRRLATRTVTETLCGDPVFHRSALGKKMSGAST